MVLNKIMVLIGVLVTQALIAAIQPTITKPGFNAGKTVTIICPRQAPTKKSGIIKPPRQPEVAATAVTIILSRKMMQRNPIA